MALKEFIKDPGATLDYSIDWNGPANARGPWLASGETVVTSTWTAPTGLTKVSDSIASGKATIWLSGGVAGTTYSVANKIVTSAGRIDERTITIRVKDR
jgi:hypothetical protein